MYTRENPIKLKASVDFFLPSLSFMYFPNLKTKYKANKGDNLQYILSGFISSKLADDAFALILWVKSKKIIKKITLW